MLEGGGAMEFENPFTPSFGEIPAHLAGRRQIVRDVERAFASERRRPELTTLFSGARGTGKTALLSVLAHKAEANGWIAVGTTALPGMLEDIEIGLRRNASHLLGNASGGHITGLEIAPLGSVTFESAAEPKSNWRYRMTDMLQAVNDRGTGVLITVDEIDPKLPEMVELAAVYQHFVREDRKVALLMAGLPNNVSSLLNDKTVSFLRRAQRFNLGRIADYDVRDALIKTIRENGREPSERGLDRAVESIEGFPFLMQLVGYRSWDVDPEQKGITDDAFEAGISLAKDELEDRVLEATLRELSAEDVRFAAAMLEDEGESEIADLVERLGRSSAQVGQYRRRLIDAGVIGERGRGRVGFELPYFKEYLASKIDCAEWGGLSD